MDQRLTCGQDLPYLNHVGRKQMIPRLLLPEDKLHAGKARIIIPKGPSWIPAPSCTDSLELAGRRHAPTEGSKGSCGLLPMRLASNWSGRQVRADVRSFGNWELEGPALCVSWERWWQVTREQRHWALFQNRYFLHLPNADQVPKEAFYCSVTDSQKWKAFFWYKLISVQTRNSRSGVANLEQNLEFRPCGFVPVNTYLVSYCFPWWICFVCKLSLSLSFFFSVKRVCSVSMGNDLGPDFVILMLKCKNVSENWNVFF